MICLEEEDQTHASSKDQEEALPVDYAASEVDLVHLQDGLHGKMLIGVCTDHAECRV